MKQVISTEKVPIKMWLDNIEDGALEQAKNLANLPFIFKHVALMPDSHVGYGMPIGGVIATNNVIIPNAVGVDIGCGMCAMKTSLTEISKEQIKVLFGGSKEYHGGIRSSIPVGFDHHLKKQDEDLMPEYNDGDFSNIPICDREYDKALFSIGTLGGGNHFIEIQRGDDGHIWVMIHSGSRNFGLQIANHYNELAEGLNKKWYSIVPLKHQLAFLPIDSEEGQAYIREMQYAVEFAFANRKLMMQRVQEELAIQFPEIKFEPLINIAHNYASLENHFGSNVWVHRKGATLAREGTIGIIPGSQGTKSYIVRGLGNEDSFQSCSHGAGRRMGRGQATRDLNLEDEIRKMEEQNIVHGIRNAKDLDEASGAYKDIDVVMENQKDLVEPIVTLTPLGVVKG